LSCQYGHHARSAYPASVPSLIRLKAARLAEPQQRRPNLAEPGSVPIAVER
jgi:hypothetical protein